MLYGYCRVSTDMQESSAAEQRASLEEYAIKTGQVLTEVYSDEDVSGGMPLRDRPAGKLLWDRLTKGDTVVVTTRDRAFRSLVDAASTLMVWREQGIRLHIIDFPIDLSTDEGEMVFLQGAVFSQYERKAIGRRIRRGMAHRRKSGIPYAGTRPWGWRRKNGAWEPLPQERKIGDHMLGLRRQGLSWNAIACACVDLKKPCHRGDGSQYYHVSCVRSLVRAAQAGYPVLPQAFWLARDCEQRLLAMKSDAPRLFDAAFGCPQTDLGPAHAHHPAGLQ